MKSKSLIAFTLLWFTLDQAQATEIEPMAKAVASILGTTKAFRKKIEGKGDASVFYAKDSSGKASALAFIQHGVYEPNCTHTWAVGINPKSGKVTQVRVIEMSCPHAFPTRSPGFLGQFVGKGPADAKTLETDVHTVAKATGSSKLTAEAVRKSIEEYVVLKGKI